MPGPRVNPKVGRKDEVFVATATESLRVQPTSSDLQPDARKKLNRQKAEEIIEKALKKKGKRG